MIDSPELPFKLRGGESYQTAVYNRIAAIKRMEYLLKKKYSHRFSFRHAGAAWLQLWDLNMYGQWYKDVPKDFKIDEMFCQRGAEVADKMLKDKTEPKDVGFDVGEKIKKTFRADSILPKEKLTRKLSWKEKLYAYFNVKGG